MSYEKLIKLTTDYVLPLIRPKVTGSHESNKVQIGPEKVNRTSIRLHTFKQSLVCVSCGIKGTHFWLERNGNPQYHLNLYAINDYGHEVLMTKDHIIPKSKGGSNSLKNMQTMCTRCNHTKGNQLP